MLVFDLWGGGGGTNTAREPGHRARGIRHFALLFFFFLLESLVVFKSWTFQERERQRAREKLSFTSRKKASARSRSVNSMLIRCNSALLDLIDTFRHLHVMYIFQRLASAECWLLRPQLRELDTFLFSLRKPNCRRCATHEIANYAWLQRSSFNSTRLHALPLPL